MVEALGAFRCMGIAPILECKHVCAHVDDAELSLENISVLMLLLEKGVLDQHGETIWHKLAIMDGGSVLMEELLARLDDDVIKRTINKQENHKGMTALHGAAKYGHKRELEVLLRIESINANVLSHGRLTPLSYAAEDGQENSVQILLDSRKVNHKPKHNHPLHCAVKSRQTRVAKLLLDRTDNSGLNDWDSDGLTPFHRAISNNHISMRDMLLKLDDLDIYKRNRVGNLALPVGG